MVTRIKQSNIVTLEVSNLLYPIKARVKEARKVRSDTGSGLQRKVIIDRVKDISKRFSITITWRGSVNHRIKLSGRT